MTEPQHQILNGRKFHANDKVAYLLPEDNDGNMRGMSGASAFELISL